MAGVGGGDAAGFAAPAHHGCAGGEAAFENLIPADQTSAPLSQKHIHLFDEPALEFVFILESQRLDAGLGARVVFPGLFGDFVAADVNEFGGEQVQHFEQDILEEFEG